MDDLNSETTTTSAVQTQILSVLDVARLLNVTRSVVVSWITSGQLAGINMAKQVGAGHKARWRISPEALEEFKRSRTTLRQTEPAVVAPLIPKNRLPKTGEEFV